MDWSLTASLLAERDTRPIVVMDRRGRIELANSAFTALLRRPREELLGRRWAEVCTPREHGREVGRALRALFTSAEPRMETQVLTRDGERLPVELDVAAVGRPPLRLVAIVTRSAPPLPVPEPGAVPDVAAAHGPRGDLSYEISTELSSFGTLKAVWTSGEARLEEMVGRPCFGAFAHRDAPCLDCPLMAAAPSSWPHTVVRQAAGHAEGYEVITATPTGAGTARVSVHTIGDDTLSGLFEAKVRRMANAARLSEREGDVLRYLALGRSPTDISTVLGITERTVKFHQANLLRKLGAETRYDLLRLFF
ncbi:MULTISPECIES: PAS and helix-turn-helix domain-containing protein [unclassified Corallococcus]|uniref:PAS and helix-turn-helix domain-containing protein n=1 Tax=unclassified Corallococcus TaxID=2685029 RepID=UPI001CC024FD|nr:MULTISPECIES: PAS and helix-turn-helix domain-containing protein [unclassified Corallococcus]MBZ4332800.1 PAS and helix-turn-helix domain-containing protein [Corallococcus sp. AS-1-12]MBZ4372362.1 PAS and helix-turn-helix domain-containing protein [Corallococcus sp. AS-1-6]